MPIDSQDSMFYNAKPHIFEKAKKLRVNMTSAEKCLWQHLRNNQLLGLRFRCQHPIDIFIADFYCHKIKLVIEVDGEIHDDEERHIYDVGRTAELNNLGITVLRFPNDVVMNEVGRVIVEIERVSKSLLEDKS